MVELSRRLRRLTNNQQGDENPVLLSEAGLESGAHSKGYTDHLSAGVVDRANEGD